MKIGIDSYCYHRFFGEVYPGLETDPGTRLTITEVIDKAKRAGARGISIESFMLTGGSAELSLLREKLSEAGMDCVMAWGHPKGLGSGLIPEALDDLQAHVEIANMLGASVTRICAGGRATRTLSWSEHRSLLVPLLRKAANFASDRGVVLAVENHIDMSADEMLELLSHVDHPSLGVCFDTANNLRMLEDPMVVARKLIPYARAAHVKDIQAYRGSPRDFSFWPSVPLGKGLIDMKEIVRLFDAHGFNGLLAIETDYLHPDYPDLDAVLGDSVAYLSGLVSDAASARRVCA